MPSYSTGLIVPPDFAAHHTAQQAHAARMGPATLSSDSAYGLLPPAGRLPLPTDRAHDWRTPGLVIPGQGIVGPVQNQGQCGCCWDFATIAAFESSIAKNFHVLPGLSEQYVLDVAAILLSGGTPIPWSCGGGWWAFDIFTASKNLTPNPGVPLRSDLPYQAAWQPYTQSLARPYAAATWGYVSGKADLTALPTSGQLKQALCDFGPLVIGTIADSSWQRYTGGVLTTALNNPSAHVNHAVLLIGWDDASGYWLIKNQWGTGWGESGFARVAYGCYNVGTAAAWVLPATPRGWVPPRPTPTPTPAPTTLTLTCAPGLVAIDEPLTVTACVTSTTPGTITGLIGFNLDNGPTVLYVAPDASGHATLTLSTRDAGSHAVQARYHGGSGYPPSDTIGVAFSVIGGGQ